MLDAIFSEHVAYFLITNVKSKADLERPIFCLKLTPTTLELIERSKTSKQTTIFDFAQDHCFLDDQLMGTAYVQELGIKVQKILRMVENEKALILVKPHLDDFHLKTHEEKENFLSELLSQQPVLNIQHINVEQLTAQELEKIVGGAFQEVHFQPGLSLAQLPIASPDRPWLEVLRTAFNIEDTQSLKKVARADRKSGIHQVLQQIAHYFATIQMVLKQADGHIPVTYDAGKQQITIDSSRYIDASGAVKAKRLFRSAKTVGQVDEMGVFRDLHGQAVKIKDLLVVLDQGYITTQSDSGSVVAWIKGNDRNGIIVNREHQAIADIVDGVVTMQAKPTDRYRIRSQQLIPFESLPPLKSGLKVEPDTHHTYLVDDGILVAKIVGQQVFEVGDPSASAIGDVIENRIHLNEEGIKRFPELNLPWIINHDSHQLEVCKNHRLQQLTPEIIEKRYQTFRSEILKANFKDLFFNYYQNLDAVQDEMRRAHLNPDQRQKLVDLICSIGYFAGRLDGLRDLPEDHYFSPIALLDNKHPLFYDQLTVQTREKVMQLFQDRVLTVEDCYTNQWLHKVRLVLLAGGRDGVDGKLNREFINDLVSDFSSADEDVIASIQSFVLNMTALPVSELLRGSAQLDDICLSLKTYQCTPEKKEHIQAQHQLRIAKRELAQHVSITHQSRLKKMSRRLRGKKDRIWINSFTDILFNDELIKALSEKAKEDNVSLEHVNLLIANIIILEQRLGMSDETPNPEARFKTLGIETIFGQPITQALIQQWIAQGMQSTQEVKQKAIWVQAFARSLNANKRALETLNGIFELSVGAQARKFQERVLMIGGDSNPRLADKLNYELRDMTAEKVDQIYTKLLAKPKNFRSAVNAVATKVKRKSKRPDVRWLSFAKVAVRYAIVAEFIESGHSIEDFRKNADLQNRILQRLKRLQISKYQLLQETIDREIDKLKKENIFAMWSRYVPSTPKSALQKSAQQGLDLDQAITGLKEGKTFKLVYGEKLKIDPYPEALDRAQESFNGISVGMSGQATKASEVLVHKIREPKNAENYMVVLSKSTIAGLGARVGGVLDFFKGKIDTQAGTERGIELFFEDELSLKSFLHGLINGEADYPLWSPAVKVKTLDGSLLNLTATVSAEMWNPLSILDFSDTIDLPTDVGVNFSLDAAYHAQQAHTVHDSQISKTTRWSFTGALNGAPFTTFIKSMFTKLSEDVNSGCTVQMMWSKQLILDYTHHQLTQATWINGVKIDLGIAKLVTPMQHNDLALAAVLPNLSKSKKAQIRKLVKESRQDYIFYVEYVLQDKAKQRIQQLTDGTIPVRSKAEREQQIQKLLNNKENFKPSRLVVKKKVEIKNEQTLNALIVQKTKFQNGSWEEEVRAVDL